VKLDVDAIKRTMQSALQLSGTCEVSILAQGAFNKLYVVKNGDKEIVARVTLPVDPTWKTLSEVATIFWVRNNTSLPVPDYWPMTQVVTIPSASSGLP
jgi:hypothetical protein